MVADDTAPVNRNRVEPPPDIELSAYLPQAVDQARYGNNWAFSGSVLFADVSGFTKLSERLAGLGRAGAEELTAILNSTFTKLLDTAFSEGGDLLSYGGDALLLAFEGPHHAIRSVRAAMRMRGALHDQGPVHTDAGRVRLRISQGIHTDEFQVIVAGTQQRELMLLGRAATTVTDMEGAADAGDVLVSAATAAHLPDSSLGATKADGVLIRRTPPAAPVPPVNRAPETDLRSYLPHAVLERIGSTGLDPEHRFVGVGFLQVRGVDDHLTQHGAAQTATAITHILDTSVRSAEHNDVCVIATDIAPNGVKLIFTAGTPAAVEDAGGRLATTLRTVLDEPFDLPVRAGAHVGHVFAGEVGSPIRQVYTVIGDAVNLSARLMGKAEDGQVVASASLLEQTAAAFSTVKLDPFYVKGKSGPQQAAVVERRLANQDVRRLDETPFIGRDAEMRTLTDALADAAAGRGNSVSIVGSAGTGKSRLLHAFLDQHDDVTTYRIVSEPYQAGRPFFAARLLLRAVLGISQDADPASAGHVLEAAIAAISPEFLPYLPLIALPVDATVEPTPTVEEVAEENRGQVLKDVVSRLLTASLTSATALVFEDADNVDDSSADLFAYAFANLHRRPWLVLLTQRTGASGLHAGRGFPSERIELQPFGRSQLLHLARQACDDHPLPDVELEDLVDRAAGNPLFLLELVRARVDADTDTELPSTLEGIITIRLDRLSPDDRRVLRHVAVLGDRFPPDLAVEVLADLVPTVAEPSTWQRLGEFVVDDQGDRRFSHSLLREVAYEGLPYARRRVVHARLAEQIERQPGDPDALRLDLMALHFDLAGRRAEAFRYCHLAGERARRDGANVEAASFYQRALANARRLDDLDQATVSELAEAWGDTAELAARYDDAKSGYRTARAKTDDDPKTLTRLLRKEGVVRERTARYRSALDWYRKAQAAAELLDPESAAAARAEILLAISGAKMHQGRLKACITAAEQALAEALAAGNRRAEAHACYLLDVAHTDLGSPDAERYRHRALPIFEELGDNVGIARTLGNLAVDARYEGHWTEALDLARRCSDAQRRSGDVAGLAMSRYNAAEILQDQGILDKAEGMLTNSRRAWRAAGFTLGVGAATGALGRVAIRSGRLHDAATFIAEAIDTFADLGAATWEAEMRAHRVELDLYAGDWQAVLAAVPVSESDGFAGQDAALQSKLMRFRGVALAATGDADASETFRRAIDLAEGVGAKYELALAHHELERCCMQGQDGLAARLLAELGVVNVDCLVPPFPTARTA